MGVAALLASRFPSSPSPDMGGDDDKEGDDGWFPCLVRVLFRTGVVAAEGLFSAAAWNKEVADLLGAGAA